MKKWKVCPDKENRKEHKLCSVNWKNIIRSKSYSSVIFVKDLQSNSKYSLKSSWSTHRKKGCRRKIKLILFMSVPCIAAPTPEHCSTEEAEEEEKLLQKET